MQVQEEERVKTVITYARSTLGKAKDTRVHVNNSFRVKNVMVYLGGLKFVVIIDHKPFTNIRVVTNITYTRTWATVRGERWSKCAVSKKSEKWKCRRSFKMTKQWHQHYK